MPHVSAALPNPGVPMFTGMPTANVVTNPEALFNFSDQSPPSFYYPLMYQTDMLDQRTDAFGLPTFDGMGMHNPQ